MPTFEQFFQSITQQESGGDWHALGIVLNMPYGKDRAYGRYQVMGANVGPWTAKYYGKRLTPEQFRFNKEAQEKVARGRLQEYVNKYGYRGAASAWYSGNPNNHMSTAPQRGGPSIKGYVDQVMARAEGLPASGGGSSGGGGSGGGSSIPTPRQYTKEELAEQYGYVLDLFNSVPELKALFDKATKGQWTGEKFQAEIRDTKWWKSRPESARKWLVLQNGDPATAKQQLDQMIVKLTQTSAQLGGPTDNKTIRAMAMEAIMNGWTDGQIRWQISKRINMYGDRRPGEAGENYDKLAGYAYEMGVKMAEGWLDTAAKKVVGGAASLQDFEDQIRKSAKGIYSNWGKQIDAGQTVAELASPYFQSMASILELPPGSVNLFDPLIKRALQAKDSSGKSVIKPMWQFENDLRNDPRWKRTANAQNSLMQVAHQVLSDFGVTN